MGKNFKNHYRGKVVLVTGHTGFKGCWLSLWLAELGAQVIGFSLGYPTKPNLFQSINLKDKITHLTGDIRDEKNINRVFRKYQPEYVFHMAAQSLVRLSYKEPRLTFETNVLGTVNILEAVRRQKSVKVCIVVTSDKCYRHKEGTHYYEETDPLGGRDPYSASKAGAELVTEAYRQSFFHPQEYGKSHGVAVASVRSGNVIGGGDWGENRLIPDCIRSLSQGKEIVIRHPKATRPWQYVTEPLAGYLFLGKMLREAGGEYAGAWNFGPTDKKPLTVEELVKSVIEYWGCGHYRVDTSKQPFESPTLSLNSSKACALLKWKLIYENREAVDRTVKWYKNFYHQKIRGDKLYHLTVGEIQEYSDRFACEIKEEGTVLSNA